MKVLVACEESQRVCTAFRNRGHEAYSCDILPPSGDHPEWHIQSDVTPYILGNCSFYTVDGTHHHIDAPWDLLIAHPPCTYLTNTGNRWFNVSKYGERAIKRIRDREKAAAFFMLFIHSNAERIAIENPIGYMSSYYNKPTQIIQPYMFGDPERKSTCLWLKNLPNLVPTNIVEPEIYYFKNGTGNTGMWHIKTLGLPTDERARLRSQTFPGIAQAMAEQWG